MKNFLKKNYGNLLILVFLALLIIPQTGTPIKVFFNRIISFSPGILSEEDQTTLQDYNWVIKDLDGGLINLDRSREKVLIINFWATWCPPCIAEMPAMQKLYADYGDKVDFYFISSEDAEVIGRFLEARGLNLPVYRQISATPDLLSHRSLPTTFLIDREGKIIIRKKGAANWNSVSTRELLDQLIEP